MKHSKLFALITVLVMLFSCALSGCGDASSTSVGTISIMSDGEAVTRVEIVDKTVESMTLTAVTDVEGEITWTSSDAGVVKVEASSGDNVTLVPLKVGYARITATCGDAKNSCMIVVNKNQDSLSEKDTALSMNGVNYSSEKINFYYVTAYNSFVNTYGSYASYYGLDTSTGISGLESQSCSYSDDGTWKGYFLESALTTFKQYTALCDYAAENDITLDEDELADIAERLETVKENATTSGYTSVDAYLAYSYGTGATLELYEEYLTTSDLAYKVYNQYSENLSFTDDEIAENYETLGYEEGENDYTLRSMRHILIMAESNDDGEYTDEAIAAAHDEAQKIYDEWLAGEATEESFAELANEYSDDSGSNTAGGLYENIYDGRMITPINDFLFNEEHEVGDTTILDYNDSYTGTHIVYYLGEGELYSTYLSVQDLKSDSINNWLTELTDPYEITEGADYSAIGDF